MRSSKQKLVIKYFKSLVREFIKDKKHHDITFRFKNYIKNNNSNSIILGNATHRKSTEKFSFLWIFRWEEIKHYYTITFLDTLDSDGDRGNLVHEFTHLWHYSKENYREHEHDDYFYFKMDCFEDWLDKKWNLPPRKNKGSDWFQHIIPWKRKWREAQYPNSEPVKIYHKINEKNHLRVGF